MYWEGYVSISSDLNSGLQCVRDLDPVIILIILFFKLKNSFTFC
jgi:hypothetical protein